MRDNITASEDTTRLQDDSWNIQSHLHSFVEKEKFAKKVVFLSRKEKPKESVPSKKSAIFTITAKISIYTTSSTIPNNLQIPTNPMEAGPG
jgi:hypothetical protein